MSVRGHITRRKILVGAASSGALLMATLVRPGAEPTKSFLTRKNIDMLTPSELDNYKHAVNILRERGSKDSSRQDGYAYQASLHNRARKHPDGSVGACEHGSEQFFPWHRPHLANFEKLLREADPARTANVTLPYWDWTKPPSGKMVPTAFEDKASPLFNAGRRTSGSPPMWDGDDIRDMVREPDWELFAGRPKGPNSSFGAFEVSAHNTMHGGIGSTMANPGTAANDPIYWSFHAYVDLVWARWQRLHKQTFGCGSCRLWLEPDSYTLDEKVTTRDWDYEYDYDFDPDGPPVALVAAKPSSTPLPLTESTDQSATAALATEQPGKRTILKIEKVVPLQDASYRVNVYVHPANLKPEGMTEEQRRQYLARTLTIWQSSGHHPEASDVLVDITRALAKAGADRRVSVVVESAPSDTPTPLGGAPLRIQNLMRGLAVEEH